MWVMYKISQKTNKNKIKKTFCVWLSHWAHVDNQDIKHDIIFNLKSPAKHDRNMFQFKIIFKGYICVQLV